MAESIEGARARAYEAIDLIVANPPYLVDPAGRVYRNGGGSLGTGLGERIVAEGLPRLRAGGQLLLLHQRLQTLLWPWSTRALLLHWLPPFLGPQLHSSNDG